MVSSRYGALRIISTNCCSCRCFYYRILPYPATAKQFHSQQGRNMYVPYGCWNTTTAVPRCPAYITEATAWLSSLEPWWSWHALCR